MRQKLWAVATLVGMLSIHGTPVWSQATGEASGKININTADEATLAKLSGIGTEGAKAIIEYRTKHGPFKVVDDLKEVPGITDLTVERLGERRLTTGDK
jgi:competence protein ComEA